MPFDDTLHDEIERIKLAVRKARAEGRLVCDNPDKFVRVEFSTDVGGADVGGIRYVCALGAWEEVVQRRWYEPAVQLVPVRRYAHLLMQAHDELFDARKRGHARAIARAEKMFTALLA